MGQLRITFVGLGLFVNRPLGLVAIMPAAAHQTKIIGPWGEVPLEPGSSLRLVANDGPLELGPTLRSSSEYIPHLDHVYGRKTACPAALLQTKLEGLTAKDVNARLILSGGMWTGLPAVVYNGLLRDVLWKFDPAGQRKQTYLQKLTDSSVYTCTLPNGDYWVDVDSREARLKFAIADTPTDITLFNEDRCLLLENPDYSPQEVSSLFALVEKLPFPAVHGIPSTGIARAAEGARALVKKTEDNPLGCACDPICCQMQMEE